MTLSAVERDDIAWIVRTHLEFFGVTPKESEQRIWRAALAGYGVEAIRASFERYVRDERRAPKPVDILNRLPSRSEDTEPAPMGPAITGAAGAAMARRIRADHGLLR